MKSLQFLIFFSIVTLVFSAVNYYIYHRAMQAVPVETGHRIYFKWGFILLALTYFAGRILERYYLSVFTDVLTWIGSFWLAVMLYGFLIVLIVDFVRVADYFTGFLPEFFYSAQTKSALLYGSAISIGVLLVAGHINAINPRVTELKLNIDKESIGLKELNIAMASDIHMGTLIGPRRVKKLVETINKTEPDIILFAGDIVDEDLAPVTRQNLGESLKQLKAPLGVYGITGNHEFIGGAEQAVKYLEEHGITMLRDSVIKVADAFYVAGREDRAKGGFSGKNRKEIKEILQSTDPDKPIILMDHQPYDLHKAVEAGVDLQLSGHTHHGQLWPLNFLTKAIYEVSRGYKQKENTHFYVSVGFGGWGPPVRIGHRPEVVNIRLRFR